MTFYRNPSIIDAQLYNFDDPLAFSPYEPRYSLTVLFSYLYSLIDHYTITSQHYYQNFLAIGLASGYIALFYKETLITKTLPEVEEQYAITQIRILSFDVPILSMIVGNSFGTVYAVYIDVSVFDYDQNVFLTPVLCSAIPDTINALDYSQGTVALGYNSGKVFLVSMPPKQYAIKLYQPQLVQNAEILDLKFMKNYLLFINRKELLIFDVPKKYLFTKYQFADIITAVITVDADVCYVAVNDLVVVYLLHDSRCDMTGSPLSIAIYTALLLTPSFYQNANSQRADFSENLQTFNNFSSTYQAEWDFSHVVPDNTKMQAIKRPYTSQQQAYSSIIFEEISRFYVYDPPILIQALLPCGENLLILGLSEPDQVCQSCYEYIQANASEYYNSWTAFNSVKYMYSEMEKYNYCVHLMCYDIFGSEVFGNLLPIQQIQTEGTKYAHGSITPIVDFSYACEVSYNSLPTYFVTTQETIFLLVPATIYDHIRYLLANYASEKAFLATLLFDNKNDNDLLKGINYYAYCFYNKIRPLFSKQEMYSNSFYHNFKPGVCCLDEPDSNNGNAVGYAESQEDKLATYDPFNDLFGLISVNEQNEQLAGNEYPGAQPEKQEAKETNQHYQILYLPDKLSFYNVFLHVTNTLLTHNLAKKACFILEQLINETDTLWTTLALRFGMSSSFKDIVKMLPLPEIEPRLGLLSLTLAHSFESTTRLLLKWKMEAFPRQILPILELFYVQRPQSAELHASQAVIYLMLQEYQQALQHIIYGSSAEAKVADIYQQFADDLLNKGVFEQKSMQARQYQVLIDQQLQKDLISSADVLFYLNITQSARLFTKIASAGDFISDIFTVLVIGVAKHALGVHASQYLTKFDFQNDMRNLRLILIQFLCVYQNDIEQFYYPDLEVVRPIYYFLAYMLKQKDQFVLNCFPESGASLQDFLLYYTPYFEPDQLQNYLYLCQSTSYLQTLRICQQFTDIDVFLRFVVYFYNRDHKTILPEQYIAFLQQALRIALGAGAVQNAIEFIRRLQEVYSANPQQGRILRQARLWQFLTKHLQSGNGVVELLDLIAKESVPVDVQEVIDMLGIEGDQRLQLGEVLFRLVDSLRIMFNLYAECAGLVKNDCISMRGRLFKEAQRAVFVRQSECKFCGDIILHQDELYKAKTRSSDFIAFYCGHFWHFECITKCEEDMKGKGIVWYGEGELVCPVCAQRVI